MNCIGDFFNIIQFYLLIIKINKSYYFISSNILKLLKLISRITLLVQIY